MEGLLKGATPEANVNGGGGPREESHPTCHTSPRRDPPAIPSLRLLPFPSLSLSPSPPLPSPPFPPFPFPPSRNADVLGPRAIPHSLFCGFAPGQRRSPGWGKRVAQAEGQKPRPPSSLAAIVIWRATGDRVLPFHFKGGKGSITPTSSGCGLLSSRPPPPPCRCYCGRGGRSGGPTVSTLPTTLLDRVKVGEGVFSRK